MKTNDILESVPPRRPFLTGRVRLLAAMIACAASAFAAGPSPALPTKTQSAYPDSDGQVVWDTLRGHFRLTLNVEPAALRWEIVKRPDARAAGGEYRSDAYRLRINERSMGDQCRLITYELDRDDGRPFQVLESRIECKTSYAGVYKVYTPSSFRQQNYAIDLPFRISGATRPEVDEPVVWMHQTDGRNTLVLGLLDQNAATSIEGSTHNLANGGEASGFANNYVRVVLIRKGGLGTPAETFKDSLYINADPHRTWFEALESYSAAVDQARGFTARPLSEWALNPMWHSWYAHGVSIDEAQIRDDARRARMLGVTTIEIDAGWNMPRAAKYGVDNEGDYDFDVGRFPNARGMIDAMHAAGQRVILHVAPLWVGKNARAWTQMQDYRIREDGMPGAQLDPRLKKVHEYLLAAWRHLFTTYDIDGLWYDFLELPPRADPPAAGMEVVSPDLHVAYTQLMRSLYREALELKPNAVIILRRPSANLNAKTYCTHVWPMDTPQDYNMNRRDVVFMKTFGPGVLTHACCTSWTISESDVNVARQMASITLAGVPAFSVGLAESPAGHNAIIKAWLAFYEQHKRDLVLGAMTPLLPTPPSAAIRIEGENEAFFGFFEAVPGLVAVTKPVDRIILVNAYSRRTVVRVEGIERDWQVQTFDQLWQPIRETRVTADANGGVSLDVTAPTECHAIVLTRIW